MNAINQSHTRTGSLLLWLLLLALPAGHAADRYDRRRILILAVALPAVMGYNWLTRSNRVLTAKLDAFAFELLTFLSMGRALQAGRVTERGNGDIDLGPLTGESG